MTMPVIPDISLSETAEQIRDAITHIAIGTGDYTNIGVDDTHLVAEIARIAPTEYLLNDAELTINAFFPQSALSGTITEVAIIKDGTGARNSGEPYAFFPVTFDSTSGDFALSIVLEVDR